MLRGTSRYQALIWDFDGTLADTIEAAIAAYNELAARYGGRQIAERREVQDLTTADFLKSHQVPLSKLPALVREFLQAQRAHLDDVQLFPGLGDVLHALHSRGERMGIVSSNNEHNIRYCLNRNGVEQCFDRIDGYSQLFGKQSGIRKMARSWEVPLEDVLYLGDEVRDARAARKAPVDFAAVTWGLQGREMLSAEQPKFLLDRPDELMAAVS